MRLRAICFSLVLVSAFCIRPGYAQLRSAANVLYSDAPLPIYVGLELGSGLSFWQHSTPVYFATRYPYAFEADTIHTWFPSGAAPLFGFFFGATADFSLSQAWGLIAKLNYNERRGNWNGDAKVECDMNGTTGLVTVNNDLTWMLRCVSLEAELRYSIASLHDLYLGAGFAATAIASDHYDLNQSIDGPPECSFLDISTGQSTGVRAYGIGGSLKDELAGMFVETKALIGYPIYIGARWRVDPQMTIGYPLTAIFNANARNEYNRNGVASVPKPVTVTALLSVRYQIR
jgi:hypothetical protein